MLKNATRYAACAGILALASLAGCATPGPSRAPDGSAAPRHVLGGQAAAPTQQLQETRALANDVDQRFTTGAGQTNLAEVAIGQLALQKSQNEGVRALAQRTMGDHSTVQTQLTTIAQAAGLSLPQEPSPAQRALAERLSGLSGEAFDRAYATAQVQGHVQSEATYEREIAQGQNEGLRNLARETLPTIRIHLRMARELAAELRGGSGSDDATGDVPVAPSQP